MKNLIKYKKGQRSKIRFILKQLKSENSNWLELFQGESGSGKTWCAISDCYERDPEFDVEKQLVFDFKSFMQVINSEWFMSKKIKQIIFDEPQTSISNRAWQSLINRMFNYVVTTFRHQNIVLLFCCPYRDFLDSASMKMIHCITEMVRIDKKKKKVRTKPRLQQYNSKLKKTYEHCIQVIHNGMAQKMFFDSIPKPPQDMIDTYERMKTDFTFKLNKDIENKLQNIENKERVIDERQPLTEKQKQTLILYQKHKKMIKVAEIMGCDTGMVSRRIKACRKKGYTPENYQNL